MPDLPETMPRPHRLTRADYYRMAEAGILAPDARVELIEGEIIDMPPIGSRHAGTVSLLVRDVLRAVHDQALVRCQCSVVLDDLTEPEPDICLVRPRPDSYRDSHPTAQDVLLVIEVADTTLAYDRDVKSRLYARAGIPEYWIVDLNAAAILVHRNPTGEAYRQVTPLASPGMLTVAALPGIDIDLGALWR